MILSNYVAFLNTRTILSSNQGHLLCQCVVPLVHQYKDAQLIYATEVITSKKIQYYN